MNMNSANDMADATLKLFYAETLSKDLSLYEENVSKLLDEVLEILDRISTSPVEPNQEPSSMLSDAQMISAMKIRAHALRISNWNGNMDKLSMIRSSCVELGKLNHTMKDEEFRVFNEKLKVSLNQTVVCISGMISGLNIKSKQKYGGRSSR